MFGYMRDYKLLNGSSSWDRRKPSHHRELINRASRAAKSGALLELAEFAEKATQAGASSQPELQKLLHDERFRLRRALLRNARDALLRRIYLQSREQLKRRDRTRESVLRASIGILIALRIVGHSRGCFVALVQDLGNRA